MSADDKALKRMIAEREHRQSKSKRYNLDDDDTLCVRVCSV